jgi:alpha-L-rhamnosidase
MEGTIRHDATTIWERWDGWTEERGFQDPDMNSFNHYSLGSVGEWLYRSVAGIDLDPDRPGYEHIVIRPHVGGGLSSARAAYRSIRGPIESGWTVEDGRFTLNVTIPANTTATVYLPGRDASQVTESGTSIEGTSGVELLGVEDDRVVLAVQSGSYRLAVSG